MIQGYGSPAYGYPAMPSGYGMGISYSDLQYGGGLCAGGAGADYFLQGYYEMDRQLKETERSMQLARTMTGRADRSDVNLIRGVRSGQLNKAEFVALSSLENELRAALGQARADGVIDRREEAQIQALQQRFDASLKAFKEGDFQPASRGSREDGQSGALFDLMAQGKITSRQARDLRAMMSNSASQAGFERGRAASEELSPEDLAAAQDERAEEIEAALEERSGRRQGQ